MQEKTFSSIRPILSLESSGSLIIGTAFCMSTITHTSPRPSIAVIVPIYNVADYLVECIRSILAQTYQHFTLIAIDDGSTDGSGEIAERLSQEDARIVVLHQVNGGLLWSVRN